MGEPERRRQLPSVPAGIRRPRGVWLDVTQARGSGSRPAMRVGANLQYSDVSVTAAGTAAKNTDYPNMMFVPLKTSSPIVVASPLAFSACPETASPLALLLLVPAHPLRPPIFCWCRV